MCGLTFIHNQLLSTEQLRQRASRALSVISHRGPDDEGIWTDNKTCIGHRRLAIIDLSSSRQPMSDPSNRYVLAYNGEIYNYKELREALKTKWEFQTNGDTEVVLAGLILEGHNFLKKMEGMWAFALWDKHNESLMLSRDRVGKKPLFYQETNGAISCASELPGLKQLSVNGWTEDPNSSTDYLRHGYFLPGTTAYRNIHEVLPAHFLTWNREHGIQQRSYWELPVGGFKERKSEAKSKLVTTLNNAVQKRMIADVEVGAFLSGGIDSSLIVSILKNDLDITPKTFTIGFMEESFDETPFAKVVAEQFGTDHYVEYLEKWDHNTLTKLITDHIGQPFYDPSLLPTYLVSGVASQQVKVCLSGDGGDELFSGYQRYQSRALLRWYTRLPAGLRKQFNKIIKMIPEPFSHHSRSLLKKAHLFVDITERLKDETPYTAPLLYSNLDFEKLAPDLAGLGHAAPKIPEESTLDNISEMMAADFLVYLPQDVLVKVDRASMAHSLEARAPFLDHKVIEHAFSLPRTFHRRGFSGKRILKEAYRDYLPASIWNRRKQGFGVPIHQWFYKELTGTLVELLNNTSNPLNHDYVNQLIASHTQKKQDNGYRLWNIYVYLLFLSSFEAINEKIQ